MGERDPAAVGAAVAAFMATADAVARMGEALYPRHCRLLARPLGMKPPAHARGNLPGGWAGYALARPDTVPRYQPKR